MAEPTFWTSLRTALDSPRGAEALLHQFDPQALVEYLIKYVIHQEAVLKTQAKLQLAKAQAHGDVRCARTNIKIPPDDVQGVMTGTGELCNTVTAYNDGIPLTNPIVGVTASPPAPAEAAKILRAIVAESIVEQSKPLQDLKALLPPDATDGFLVLVRNHPEGADTAELESAAKEVLASHAVEVQARAKRVVAVLEAMPAPTPPQPPEPRAAAPKRPAPGEPAGVPPPTKQPRPDASGSPPDTLPPDNSAPIRKTEEGRWPRVDGVTVMTTKFGGPCKGCPRRNVAGRTVIAPKDEPDGSTKWCCTLCVINKTSAAVYAEVGQSNLETAAAAVAGDPVSRQATNSIRSFF